MRAALALLLILAAGQASADEWSRSWDGLPYPEQRSPATCAAFARRFKVELAVREDIFADCLEPYEEANWRPANQPRGTTPVRVRAAAPVLADVSKDPRLSQYPGILCGTSVEKVPSKELQRIKGTSPRWAKQRDKDLLRCLDDPERWSSGQTSAQ